MWGRVYRLLFFLSLCCSHCCVNDCHMVSTASLSETNLESNKGTIIVKVWLYFTCLRFKKTLQICSFITMKLCLDISTQSNGITCYTGLTKRWQLKCPQWILSSDFDVLVEHYMQWGALLSMLFLQSLFWGHQWNWHAIRTIYSGLKRRNRLIIVGD